MSHVSHLLAGRSILVVEDEYLIALHLAALLEEQHADVVGPVGNTDGALRLIRTAPHLDGALLNVNLGNEMVFPVVDALRERHVPFAFVTSYEWESLPERYNDVPLFEKDADLVRIAEALFG